MMSSDENDSVEARLTDLISRGYRFIHPRDRDGRIVAVVGIRVHHTVVDVLRMDGENDVTAFRAPGDEHDILEPSRKLWETRGPADGVLDQLLSLPDENPATGRHVRGCWVPGAGGHAKWLAAVG